MHVLGDEDKVISLMYGVATTSRHRMRVVVCNSMFMLLVDARWGRQRAGR